MEYHKEFKNIDYIFEFVLYTDYYGPTLYYQSVRGWDNVVYKDGTMEVPNLNLLSQYSMKNYTYDYSNIIEEIKDCGDKYNCTKKLK